MIINPGMRRSGVRRFSPLALFAASETGVWYDPSDLTTLFQDTSGITPVTAAGQTVALMLDKSRVPAPEARRNLLFLSQSFVSPWSISTGSITATNLTAPDGTATGSTLTASGGNTRVNQTVSGQTAGATYTFSAYVKASASGGAANVRLTTNNSFSWNTGQSQRFALTSEWQRFVLTGALSNLTSILVNIGSIDIAGNNDALCAGNIDIWGAQLEAGPTATAYQAIGASLPTAWRGTHATQATAAARPTYGIEPMTGRRNLLLATDTLATQSVTVTAVAHTLSFTGTGTVTLTGASIAGPLIGTGAGNRVSLTFTPTAGSLTLTVVGSVTLAQLELGSTATAYQRVTTQFDVTEAGVASKSYLSFDGVDDNMVTGTITPGSADKAQVFAGVRKLTDATQGMIVEYSATVDTNNGTFFLMGARSGGGVPNYGFRSKGTILRDADATGYTAPITNVLGALGDISGDRATLRVNATQVTQSTGDQGTGNYLAYPLYIGRRGGTSIPYNGNVYSLITRFSAANMDAATITNTETWVNSRTGAY